MVYGWNSVPSTAKARRVSDVRWRVERPDQRPTQDDELRWVTLVPAGNAQTETTLPEARHRQPSGTADGGHAGRAAGGLSRLGHRARRALPRCPCRRGRPVTRRCRLPRDYVTTMFGYTPKNVAACRTVQKVVTGDAKAQYDKIISDTNLVAEVGKRRSSRR